MERRSEDLHKVEIQFSGIKSENDYWVSKKCFAIAKKQAESKKGFSKKTGAVKRKCKSIVF